MSWSNGCPLLKMFVNYIILIKSHFQGTKKYHVKLKKVLMKAYLNAKKKKKIIPYEIIKPLVNYMRFVKLYNT